MSKGKVIETRFLSLSDKVRLQQGALKGDEKSAAALLDEIFRLEALVKGYEAKLHPVIQQLTSDLNKKPATLTPEPKKETA